LASANTTSFCSMLKCRGHSTHHENFQFRVRGDGKGKADVHSRRVLLHWRINGVF
jgi:hypothetical protein